MQQHLVRHTMGSFTFHMTYNGVKVNPDSVLQAVYLDTLGSSGVRWHLVERTLGSLTKAKPELWDVMVATALETGADNLLMNLHASNFRLWWPLSAVEGLQVSGPSLKVSPLVACVHVIYIGGRLAPCQRLYHELGRLPTAACNQANILLRPRALWNAVSQVCRQG